MSAQKWTTQEMAEASGRLQSKITELQSKMIKLQYTSKRPYRVSHYGGL